jgi:hypothetical protein
LLSGICITAVGQLLEPVVLSGVLALIRDYHSEVGAKNPENYR